ncbi:MAG: hypothetical protein M9904_11945 [Chitinophagaceae bacterium]|nr:hypothetical protein [Chitinophagaceae bacterium]
MYNKFQLAFKYLRYYLTASNGSGHGVHSPFVFDFITSVLNDKRFFYAYDRIERLRRQALADNREVEVQDYGAGSVGISSRNRKERADARRSLKSPNMPGCFSAW